jgi:hypothetical protein
MLLSSSSGLAVGLGLFLNVALILEGDESALATDAPPR